MSAAEKFAILSKLTQRWQNENEAKKVLFGAEAKRNLTRYQQQNAMMYFQQSIIDGRSFVAARKVKTRTEIERTCSGVSKDGVR